MATTHVYKNSKVYSGQYNISGATNTFALDYAFAELEVKALGQECPYYVPGLAKLTFDLNAYGYSDGTDEVDDVLAGRLGSTSAVPMTWAPMTGAAGEVAYFAETLELAITAGGQVGELYMFGASGVGQGTKLVRGTLMETGAKTATANGTVRQLGAVSATQYLYACLHVFDVSGTNPTLDVTIESDDAEAFTGALTKGTFTQKTAVGSQFLTPVAGPITDDWWRIVCTIGGTDTPTFNIAVSVGIL